MANADFQRASALASRFVSELSFLEDFSLVSMESRYLSDQTRANNQAKAEQVLRACFEKALGRVRASQADILRVKEALVDREELTREDVEGILRKGLASR